MMMSILAMAVSWPDVIVSIAFMIFLLVLFWLVGR